MSGPLRFASEAEWLAWRQGKVGGSLIGAVLGLDDAWDTPLGAYQLLTGLASPPVDNLAMRVGRVMQRQVAIEWAAELDFYQDVEEGEAFDDPDEPRLSATLDYRVDVEDAPASLLEVKVTGARDRWTDGPPDYVEAQARWQLGLVRANGIPVERCHVVVCTVPGWKITSWPVDHDEAIWQDMRAAAVGFLRNHVDARRPPRAVIADLDRLTPMAGVDSRPLIAEGDQAADLQAAALDYFDRAARARETAKDADEAKAVLYQLLGEHTDAWIAGRTDQPPLVAVSRRSRASVATKKMPPWLIDTLIRRGHLTYTSYPTLKVRTQ